MVLDWKVYVTGCVSCHKVITRLREIGELNIETNENIVSKVASETIGFVPVFEFDNKFYNEYEISTMLNNGEKFILPKVVIEEKIINKKIKQEE